MSKQRVIAVFTLVALMLVAIGALSSAQNDSDAKVTDLTFVNHLQAGLIEQDVLIKNEAGEVVRIDNTAPIANLYQPVYGTADAQPHDPFGLFENPYGPFEVGQDLGFSLAEWLKASATGSYAVDGERATLRVEAKDLIPNGVYTVWCARLIPPPDFRFIDLPCGAADGSENIFTADANGDYVFELEMDALEAATPENIPLIALAYHSDGQTYGPLPGDFALNSHVQIFAMIMPEA